MDLQFIELFDTGRVQADMAFLPGWPEILNDEYCEISEISGYEVAVKVADKVDRGNAGKEDDDD
jgi:hypothetical protein